jgi:hypothetical protein
VVDAIVALTILSMTLALSLSAASAALTLSARAATLQAARQRLIGLVIEPPARIAPHPLPTPAATWTVKAAPLGGPEGHRLCRVDATLTAAVRTRPLTLSAVRPCPEPQS